MVASGPEMPGTSSVKNICTIVVPCYNEAARFHSAQYSAFLVSEPQVHLLFVNDGSTDGTLAVLNELQAMHPECVQVLDQGVNKGKAEAVRSGMVAAIGRGDCVYTGFWDADLAAPLEAIPMLMGKLDEDPRIEMVFGSRVRLLGHSIHRKSARHYLGRCFATVVSNMLRLPIYDTQCGAKLFRITPELRQLLASPFQSRWIFDVEMIARFLALHHHDPEYLCNVIYEYPLPRWQDVDGSKVTPLDFPRAMVELFHIWKSYLS